MPEFKFVDLNSNVTFSEFFDPKKRIGLDTEFMRERTFFAQLCLVQISTSDSIYCADPMGAVDLDCFWRDLMDCQWVVHSARQDIEVLYQTSNRMPRTLFDTQIAAALSGLTPQLGYAGLVQELFGVELAKSHTRADWSRRPLPSAVLEYAAEDVEYLLPAYEMLGERLSQLGRLRWAEEDSAALLKPALYNGDPGQAIGRLRGARNLRGRARAAAARLAAWRESEAERSDRPRQWIMKDAVLLEIASAGPEDEASLATIRGLAPNTLRRAANVILDLLTAARSDDSEYEPPQRPDEKHKAVLQSMQAAVSACAEELGIAAEIIAPRKELSESLYGDLASRVFTGWRRELIGKTLLEMLEA